MSVQREKIRFSSGDTECAAWHYPGGNGACVVMAGGFAVTKEPGTDLFAPRFHDGRLLGARLRLPADRGERRRAAPGAARSGTSSPTGRPRSGTRRRCPDVDPTRLAIWGFSHPAATCFRVAARNPQLAAAIAQTPNADGLAGLRNAARHQKPAAMLRFTGRALLDTVGGCRRSSLVPLVGPPGTVAMLTTPDAQDGDRALNPGNRYPDWQQAVAARSALRLGVYSPGRVASRIRCPLLVVVCDDDQTALAGPAVRVARRAPRAELVRLPGGHYEPFLDGHERVVEAELSFLRTHAAAPVPAERG